MESSPRFLQGVFAFEGKGIEAPFPLAPALHYTVPLEPPPRRCTSAPATPPAS